MVEIRRAPRSRGKQFFRTSPLGYVRVALLGLVTLYGIHILWSLGRRPLPTDQKSGTSIDLEDVLKNSQLRISYETKAKVKPTPAKDLADLAAAKPIVIGGQPPPPPPIQKYHLEESDIHMIHPEALSEKKPRSEANSDPDNKKGAPIHQIVVDKNGSGPTSVAYVRDLAAERANPAFRHDSIRATDSSSLVASLVGKSKVTGCFFHREKQEDGQSVLNKQAACMDPTTPQIAYNTANFSRIWCGHEIAPNSAVVISEHCDDPVVHLFPNETPPASGRGMPPMILKSQQNNINVETTFQSVTCDIPCLQEPGITVTDGEGRRFFQGEPWMILQTQADSAFYPHAMIERTKYRQDIYYSTQSFKSSVPLSFFDPERYSLRNRPAVSFESTKPKAVYMINSSCASPSSKRQKYFAAISKVFPVESLGGCHHNTDVPEGMTMQTLEGRVALMKQYRFVLAFDGTTEKDHISPIIWEALLSGTVPVIVGADNIRLHLPTRSFIDAGAYSDWDELAQAIYRINTRKEEWESYHVWRTDEKELAKFEAIYEFTKTSPICRLCRWGYAKKYGLGWDQVKQVVTETHVSRSLCTTSETGLASKPFREEWISRSQEDEIVVNQKVGAGQESCSSTAESTIDNGSTFKIHRRLVNHDGVTDLLIAKIERASTKHKLVLRLHFSGVRNSDAAHFANSHTTVAGLEHGPSVTSVSIQDDFTKVTIVVDWVTIISCPREGVLEVVVAEEDENAERPNISKRLRVIVEDINAIHDKMTEYFPSSFATRMIKDFVDPLEVYYADV